MSLNIFFTLLTFLRVTVWLARMGDHSPGLIRLILFTVSRTRKISGFQFGLCWGLQQTRHKFFDSESKSYDDNFLSFGKSQMEKRPTFFKGEAACEGDISESLSCCLSYLPALKKLPSEADFEIEVAAFENDA